MSKEILGWFDFDDIYTDAINRAVNGSKFLEIGCFFGKSTEFLCRNIKESGKNISVFVIDAFETDFPFYIDILNGRDMLEVFKENLKEHQDILTVCKGDSSRLHTKFRDGIFDMIYIDGDHSYNGVKKDLMNYYPKLKKGGIFAGHDYTEDCGVSTAVNEFAIEKNLQLRISRSSWILNHIKS